MSDQPAIKGIAGNCHAVRPQDIVRPLATLACCRAELDQREIAGATTEISDQDELVVIELLLILIRRGDRLKHELDVGKSSLGNGGAQALQRPRISSVVVCPGLRVKPTNASA